MIGIAIVGYGYWGPNLMRNFSEAANASVVAVCDSNPDRLKKAQARFPGTQSFTDFRSLLDSKDVHGIAIATPVSSHFELAMSALQAGKHVLVEKPMAASSNEAEQLIEEAARRNLVLMVDHTFVYTGAVRQIHDLIHSGAVGEVYYYDSVRVNLGLFQHDVNVIWDLAVHDLSIMDYVLPQRPVALSACGLSHVRGQPENIAYLTMHFEGNLIGHIHVNWLAPVKVRRTLVGGSQRMIVYDDIEPSEKIKVYDKGVSLKAGTEEVYQMLVSYRTGDMWAPQLDITEALHREANHFLSCIEKGDRPITDGEAGLQTIRLLEAASQSMQERGRLVELTPTKVSV